MLTRSLFFFSFFLFFVEEDGSGEGSGSGCDPSSCDRDKDIYFSTPTPVKPRQDTVVKDSSSGVRLAPYSLLLALAAAALTLLTSHIR